MESLPWGQIGLGSGWAALLSLLVWQGRAVVKGDWIPRSTHEAQIARSEHDAQEWRTEGRIKDQQLAEQAKQLGHMSEVGTTMAAVLAALQRFAGGE